MDKVYILDFLSRNKQELQNRYGITKIGLFGSYARDEATSVSDIDIAVEIQSDNTFRSFFGLKYFIEAGLHHQIDLGIESALKPIAKETILKDIIYV
jgi:predicted nucleotidyltransferase